MANGMAIKRIATTIRTSGNISTRRQRAELRLSDWLFIFPSISTNLQTPLELVLIDSPAGVRRRSFLLDGVTTGFRSRHHAPTGLKIERPARTFEMRTGRVFGRCQRHAAKISGYQHAVRHVERAPLRSCVERGIDGIGVTQ